ncbi:hypothetical protein IPA_00225 [Ignicoccus pacificus DSM 13166]|uniref:Protein IPA_00225 n=1 Tax=Ignicoccus pacificus DSM 13166 TaxID=940294 RepID=A0A977K8U4_9CREN|nr:hypothetical protein IPA_00225 [Ignicoccus pacificus DSM 13166]
MSAPIISLDELTQEDGEFLVRTAREAIETYLTTGKIVVPEAPEKLKKLGAAFVTLLTYPERQLRGCIGYVEPIKPLIETVVDVAIAAATNDPRFYPVSPEEMDNIVVEVSVLGDHQLFRPAKTVLPYIEIGKTGLIIRRGPFSGVLLPEVPVEYCWDPETFIAETCVKAGLAPDCWLYDDTEVILYRGRTWTEVEPRGRVIERDLVKEYEERCLKGG